MTARLRSWWQKIKQHPFIVAGIIVVIFAFIAFTFAVSEFGLDWIGFTSATGPTLQPNEQYRPAKTLWDVLQLLIVPIILVIAGFWLNQIQKSREEEAIKQRAEIERKAGEKRAQTERDIANDSQREAAYQAYLDHMSDLFLKEHFSVSKPPPEDVCSMGRARTLAVLRRLDGERKGCLLLFLSESNLYKIIDLNYADLSGSDLREIRLHDAKLCEVNLRNADLSGADLAGADLAGADLTKANLSGTRVTEEQLKKAMSLKGATMPDGSKHS